MKKQVRSFILLVMFLLSVSMLTSCGSKEVLPDYAADKGVKAVRFAGLTEPPPANYYKYNGSDTPNSESYITVERYQEMKDCGINLILAHAEQNIYSENVTRALECAAEVGVQYIAQFQSAVNFSDPERMKNAIGKILEHVACAGIVVKDEPSSNLFRSLGRSCKVFQQISDKYFYINLLPTYGVTETTYEKYIESYMQTVGNDFISVDHYPYNYDGLTHRMSETWLRNLEVVQNACVKYGVEHWEFLQGNKAYPYSKTPDYYDLSHQIYVSMAYGTQVMQYYCYFTPAEFGDNEEFRCLIDYYGKQTDIYDAAKKINNEIHEFGHVFMNYVEGWKGVLPVVGTENSKEYNTAFNHLQTALTKHDRIKDVSSTEDMIIGAFEDENGYDGLMFVNYSIPGLRKTSEVSVTFNRATKAICYIGGKESIVELEKGKLNLTLAPGEGVFVIPVNA